MARPQIDLPAKINEIANHVASLPSESARPLGHYDRSANDFDKLLRYFDRKVQEQTSYRVVAAEHFSRLHSMVLVTFVEIFERFLKETAAICIDHLAGCIWDDRFDVFTIKGTALAAHFQSATVGRSLCESDTWLDCAQINKKFRRILASPFEVGDFYLFPKAPSQQPQSEQFRYEALTTVFQLRHTVVHNVGVVTPSDAAKLKLLTKQPVESPRVLTPAKEDLRYLQRFLGETANRVNERVRNRLVELLNELYRTDPSLFDNQDKADEVSAQFGAAVTIGQATGIVPIL